MLAGSYKSEKPIIITRLDNVHLKCDCIDGSIVNGCRQPILYRFGLTSPPGLEIHNQPKVKLFEKINKHVLSHITFSLENDDRKPVNFNGETISFACQLTKLQ